MQHSIVHPQCRAWVATVSVNYRALYARLQITEALKSNARLEALDVGGNNIDAEGIAVLMAALRGNTVLKTLELGYNPIEEKGAEELSAAIKYDLPVRSDSHHVGCSGQCFRSLQT